MATTELKQETKLEPKSEGIRVACTKPEKRIADLMVGVLLRELPPEERSASMLLRHYSLNEVLELAEQELATLRATNPALAEALLAS